MSEKTIEAMLASPPDRDELVVQLFKRDEYQWGEVFRQDGEYWIDLYLRGHAEPLRVTASEMVSALTDAAGALRQRLESD